MESWKDLRKNEKKNCGLSFVKDNYALKNKKLFGEGTISAENEIL